MSAGTAAARPVSRWKLSPRWVSLFIALSVFFVMFGLRRGGWLQILEFHAYDFFIRHQPESASADPIVLVEMTESDIHNHFLDYPIHDDKLAELLRILVSHQPAAIGLDIWRDIPVPKNGSGLADLNRVLETNANIIAIFTLGGIGGPPVLKGDPARIAFNDNFPVDHLVERTIPKVRRVILYSANDSGDTYFSLPFRLAMLYLDTKGIVPEIDPEDPTAMLLGKARLRKFHANDGAYIGADDGGFQMLLDFKCSEKFVRYSISDALTGKIPAGRLRDSIVLVGINTASVADERVTPTRRDHRGIDVQALSVNQLLRHALEGEPPLEPWADWQEDLWMLLWCLVGGAIGFRVRSSWWFVAESIGCLFAILGTAWLAFTNGWWIPAAGPALAYLPAAVLVTTYITAQERSMRAILMKLYARQVSKEIAEETWANRDSFLDGHRPLAQKLVVTVLFTDLKGFSTISEKMEPPQLYAWLNQYLGAMAEVVQVHGGVLKQFTGDGILALFGVPVPHLTQAEQAGDACAAVRCALAMGERLVQLNRAWHEVGLPAVSMRAGIYTGEVAAGSIGSDDRFEYAVIGDVVNTASRLESYDKTLADPDDIPNRCRILVGEPTLQLLPNGFATQEIGLIEVKGKANKVSVFLVLAENRSQAGTTVSSPQPPEPFRNNSA